MLVGPTTSWSALLMFWMMLSVPNALLVGNSFDLVFNNFLKTAADVAHRGGERPRDARRRTAGVRLPRRRGRSIRPSSSRRFDLGAGDAWRLGHLYYYDANDFATFVVTAMPLGIYFLHAAPQRADSRGAPRPGSSC